MAGKHAYLKPIGYDKSSAYTSRLPHVALPLWEETLFPNVKTACRVPKYGRGCQDTHPEWDIRQFYTMSPGGCFIKKIYNNASANRTQSTTAILHMITVTACS